MDRYKEKQKIMQVYKGVAAGIELQGLANAIFEGGYTFDHDEDDAKLYRGRYKMSKDDYYAAEREYFKQRFTEPTDFKGWFEEEVEDENGDPIPRLPNSKEEWDKFIEENFDIYEIIEHKGWAYFWDIENFN